MQVRIGWIGFALLTVCVAAEAHPGHHHAEAAPASFGWLHGWTGVDHWAFAILIAMVSWRTGQRLWTLPFAASLSLLVAGIGASTLFVSSTDATWFVATIIGGVALLAAVASRGYAVPATIIAGSCLGVSHGNALGVLGTVTLSGNFLLMALLVTAAASGVLARVQAVAAARSNASA